LGRDEGVEYPTVITGAKAHGGHLGNQRRELVDRDGVVAVGVPVFAACQKAQAPFQVVDDRLHRDRGSRGHVNGDVPQPLAKKLVDNRDHIADVDQVSCGPPVNAHNTLSHLPQQSRQELVRRLPWTDQVPEPKDQVIRPRRAQLVFQRKLVGTVRVTGRHRTILSTRPVDGTVHSP
jgi:hypothetical protein